MNRYIKLFFILMSLLSAQDGRLDLMYKSFLYSKDLPNAYRVAKHAVKKYPESLYWHKKLAVVSQWLDKRPEAMQNYLYIYSKTKEKKLRKKILNYTLQAYQYEVAAPLLKELVLEDPSAKNIKDFLFVYDQVGIPEEAAAILVKLSRRGDANPLWLPKAMAIYMELGESKLVKAVAKKIEERASLDLNTTKLLANYYFSKKDIQKSYEVLLRADIKSHSEDVITYYEQVSDIGWYLQDPENAAIASTKLFDMGHARQIDIERIIYYYNDRDPSLLQKAALYGSNQFDNYYLYMTYINTLYREKEYKKLSLEFDKIERNKKSIPMLSQSYYWLMKGQTYSMLREKAKALEAFKYALKLEHNSADITATLLWFYIDHDADKQLKDMVFEIEESENIATVLWLPLASANFKLQKPDKAMLYVKKMMRREPDSIDIKIMYAYIMQAREEREGFLKTMREVYTILNQKLKKNLALINDRVFLKHYMSASTYFMDPTVYEKLLLHAKSILTFDKYIEYSIDWSLRHNAYARARNFSSKLASVEPWMQLNIALNDDDRSKQLSLLYRYAALLPIRDRVTTALNVGSLSLAQTLAFDGLEQNSYDYLLYKQRRDIVEEYVDKVDMKLGYHAQGSIDRSYIDIDNRYYIARGWTLLSDLHLARDKNIDPRNITNIPHSDMTIDLGLRRKFERGNFQLKVGARSALEKYFSFSAAIHYTLMSRINIDLAYQNNRLAEDTTYLLLGGKKDELSTKVSLQYLPSSNILLSLFYDKFYSQDDYYLGKGYHARVDWYRQVHSAYPDIAIGAFADYGNYNESFGNIGSLKQLIPYDGGVLPEKFYNIGFNLFYGISSKELFSRVWRPYAEFSPYFNGNTNRINITFGGGYGGSLFGRDHLSIGAHYEQSVSGTQESNFKLYMNYRLFY